MSEASSTGCLDVAIGPEPRPEVQTSFLCCRCGEVTLLPLDVGAIPRAIGVRCWACGNSTTRLRRPDPSLLGVVVPEPPLGRLEAMVDPL